MDESKGKICKQCGQYKQYNRYRHMKTRNSAIHKGNLEITKMHEGHYSEICNECHKENREKKFELKKRQISENSENRLYPLSLPLKPAEFCEGPPSIRVFVFPHKYYGQIKGTELIRYFLRKGWIYRGDN